MPNKAVAAAGGSGVAGALTTLIVALWWHNATPEVATALTTLIGSLAAGLSAWLAKYEGA